MPSVQDFISEVKKSGLARTDKFKVEIFHPVGVNLNNALEIGRTVSLFCEEATIPGLTIGTRNARLHNLNVQRPATIDYGGDSANFQFFMDGAWNVRNYFDTWMKYIIDDSREVNQYKNIIGAVRITAIHEGMDSGSYSEDKKYGIQLEEAYPIAIGLMPVAYSNTFIHRLSVTFAYKYWTKF